MALLLLLSFGILEVQTPHYGATLSVDREPRGLAPLPPLSISPGLHLVEVHLRGHPSWSRLVFVPPGERVVLVVHLAATVDEKNEVNSTLYAPPAWRLQGRAGLLTTHLDRGEADLDQRWHLDAHEPLGASTRLQLEVAANTLLSEHGRFVREAGRTVRLAPDGTRLLQAHLDGRAGPVHLSAGRLRLADPSDPLGLDGLAAELPVTDRWTLSARGGHRIEPWDLTSRGAAGGVGLRHEAPGGSGEISHVFNDIHYLDARASLRLPSWTPTAQVTTAGRNLMATRLTLHHPTVEASHTYRARLFNTPPAIIELLPPDRPHEHRVDLGVTAAGLDTRLHLRLPAHPSAHQPRVVRGGLTAPLPEGLGIALHALLADSGPPSGTPALTAHAHLGLTTRHNPHPLRIETSAGLGALELREAAGTRATHLRPEGRLSLEVELIDTLALAVEAETRPVHPTWSSNPLFVGVLELRLR